MMLSKRNKAVYPAEICNEPKVYKREKSVSLPQYKKNKIKMLQRDFCLKLTEEEIETINSLESETEIDRYARELMEKHWN